MNLVQNFLEWIVQASILFFEFSGVGVLIFSGVRGVISYCRKDVFTRLNLAKGMSMALEFKLGSEILRTVIVRDISEVFMVGLIIILRATLTFLIHWEIKNAEKGHHE